MSKRRHQPLPGDGMPKRRHCHIQHEPFQALLEAIASDAANVTISVTEFKFPPQTPHPLTAHQLTSTIYAKQTTDNVTRTTSLPELPNPLDQQPPQQQSHDKLPTSCTGDSPSTRASPMMPCGGFQLCPPPCSGFQLCPPPCGGFQLCPPCVRQSCQQLQLQKPKIQKQPEQSKIQKQPEQSKIQKQPEQVLSPHQIYELSTRVANVIAKTLPRTIRFYSHGQHMDGLWIGISSSSQKTNQKSIKFDLLIEADDPLVVHDKAIVRTNKRGCSVRGYTADIIPDRTKWPRKTMTLAAFIGTCYYYLDSNGTVGPTCQYKRDAFSRTSKSCCVVETVIDQKKTWSPLREIIPDEVRHLQSPDAVFKWLTEHGEPIDNTPFVDLPRLPVAHVKSKRSSLFGRGTIK